MIFLSSIVIPLLILIPNMIFFALKPTNVSVVNNESNNTAEKILTAFEWLGRIGIFILPIFYKINTSSTQIKVFLLLMILSLGIYYACWRRFFVRNRDYSLLFKPLWLIPIPMAVSPILYMLFASFVLNSKLLLLSTVLLSIGHIPISYNEYKRTLAITKV